ncbi:hypothetical protein [Streptomyces zhihengii]|uniref:hypothetical protein n=1 Tax=Streptomyces zhihengii TaxID=1818004 RepID=UPI0033BAB544
MDITSGTRDKGVYVICSVGKKHPEHHSGCAAYGVRLELQDGKSPLAVCELTGQDAREVEEQGTQEAHGIEPWVRCLLHLATVGRLRSTVGFVQTLGSQAQRDEPHGVPLLEHLQDQLIDLATAQERSQALHSSAALASLIETRLSHRINASLGRALAYAPDPHMHPIHPSWELPGFAGVPGSNLARQVAQDLLAGWRSLRSLRDPLVTWAVHEAGLTRSAAQSLTTLSRTTINRLLDPGST